MKDFIGAVVCIMISVFVFAASEIFALKGPNASSLSRNPALYPRILAAMFTILAIALMVKALRAGSLKNIKIAVNRQKIATLIVLISPMISKKKRFSEDDINFTTGISDTDPNEIIFAEKKKDDM